MHATHQSEIPQERIKRQRRRTPRHRNRRQHREIRRHINNPDPAPRHDLVPERLRPARVRGERAKQGGTDDHERPAEPHRLAVALRALDDGAGDEAEGADGVGDAEDVDAGGDGACVFCGLKVDGEPVWRRDDGAGQSS